MSKQFKVAGVSAAIIAGLMNGVPVVAEGAAAGASAPRAVVRSTGSFEADMQARMAHLQEFMALVERTADQLLAETQVFRDYVESVKLMLANCELEGDVAGYEHTDFGPIVEQGGEFCRSYVAEFDQVAQAQSARLDEAVKFQRLVEGVSERVQGQVDQLRIAMHAKRLQRALDQGMQELEESREQYRPWMRQ